MCGNGNGNGSGNSEGEGDGGWKVEDRPDLIRDPSSMRCRKYKI